MLQSTSTKTGPKRGGGLDLNLTTLRIFQEARVADQYVSPKGVWKEGVGWSTRSTDGWVSCVSPSMVGPIYCTASWKAEDSAGSEDVYLLPTGSFFPTAVWIHLRSRCGSRSFSNAAQISGVCRGGGGGGGGGYEGQVSMPVGISGCVQWFEFLGGGQGGGGGGEEVHVLHMLLVPGAEVNQCACGIMQKVCCAPLLCMTHAFGATALILLRKGFG